MKLAVAGKGGSGKTSIAGTMARVLARGGRTVLAIDGDPGPNLALTLGIPPERMPKLPTLPTGLLRSGAAEAVLNRPLEDVRGTYAVMAGDGVELLVMARPDQAGTGCLSGLHATARAIVGAAPDDDHQVCILDTDASPESFARGVARHVDVLLLVAEPYPSSLETARRMGALARDLGIADPVVAASKVRDGEDVEVVRRMASEERLDLVGAVPYDPSLAEADRAAQAPLDFAPDGPAVAAIVELAQVCVAITENGR